MTEINQANFSSSVDLSSSESSEVDPLFFGIDSSLESLSHLCSVGAGQEELIVGEDECVGLLAESWYEEVEESSNLRRYGKFRLLDQRKWSANQHTVLMRYDTFGTQHDFSFLIHLDQSHQENLRQVEGRVGFMSEDCGSVTGEEWRTDLYQALFVMFTPRLSWLDEDFQAALLDRFEARMIYLRENPIFEQRRTRSARQVLMTEPTIIEGELPSEDDHPKVRETPLTLAGFEQDFQKEWQSKQEISSMEEKTLLDAFSFVPAQLTEALMLQNRLEGMQIEVMEDEEVDARVNDALAFHSWGDNLIAFKRSYLRHSTAERVNATVNHEFAHALHPRGEDSFISSYYENLKPYKSWDYYPYISPYAQKNQYEFFAESVVAYFNGEEDIHPIADSLRGPRDRAELREKMPEMYLAIRLYLDSPGTEFFANKEVFSQDSLQALRKIVWFYPKHTTADTSLDHLVEVYQALLLLE